MFCRMEKMTAIPYRIKNNCDNYLHRKQLMEGFKTLRKTCMDPMTTKRPFVNINSYLCTFSLVYICFINLQVILSSFLFRPFFFSQIRRIQIPFDLCLVLGVEQLKNWRIQELKILRFLLFEDGFINKSP